MTQEEWLKKCSAWTIDMTFNWGKYRSNMPFLSVTIKEINDKYSKFVKDYEINGEKKWW